MEKEVIAERKEKTIRELRLIFSHDFHVKILAPYIDLELIKSYVERLLNPEE